MRYIATLDMLGIIRSNPDHTAYEYTRIAYPNLSQESSDFNLARIRTYDQISTLHSKGLVKKYREVKRKTYTWGTVRTDLSPTICTGGGCGVVTENTKIRVLTPLECWRLMGLCPMNPDGTFDDSNFIRASSVVSNSQLYKQAGNSIVVDVLFYIFANILNPETQPKQSVLDQW